MTQPSMREGELLVGRYRMGSLLGEGGYGRVYRATQMPLGREVAIKVVNAGDKELIARFAREAEIAQRLEHPNTVRVLDYGTTPEGLPFLALELLRGKSVHELLCEKGMLDLETSLSITSQVLKSLAEAHGKGIVHRDIKPENIFVSSHPGEPVFVKVLDFGIAKEIQNAVPLTVHGEAVGTPSYMSPEQVMGMPLDGRTDIYAVGLLLAEMVTGTTVFDVGGPRTIMRAQLHSGPVALTRAVTESVVGVVVERAVRKRAAERYQNALEMLAAVEALSAHVKSHGEGGRFSGTPMPSTMAPHSFSPSTPSSGHVPPPAPSSPTSQDTRVAARTSAPTMMSGGVSMLDETRPLTPEQLKNVYALPFAPAGAESGPGGSARREARSTRESRTLPWMLILGIAVAMIVGLSVIVILLVTREGRDDRPRRPDKRDAERTTEESEPEAPKSRAPREPRAALSPPKFVTAIAEMREVFARAHYAVSPPPAPTDDDSLFMTLELADARCTGLVVVGRVADRDARIRTRDAYLQTPNSEVLVDGEIVVFISMHGLAGRVEHDAECSAAVAKLLKK